MVEHGDRLAHFGVDGELDLGQDSLRVALRHQERAALPGGLDAESLPVDQTGTGGERIDAETRPREIEERERGQDLDGHPIIATEQLDAPLGDERRARHRVEHLAVTRCRDRELLDDLRVDLLERRTALVDAVERHGVGNGRR